MDVRLTPDQQAFIRQGIASGRYLSEEDAIKEALTRWENAERRRLELLLALDEAESDLAAGRFRKYETSELPALAAELKHAGRNRRKKLDGV